MKIIEHASYSTWSDADIETYKIDREIIKIENFYTYPDGFSYFEVTFTPLEGDATCMAKTYNEPYSMIAKLDTKFEGDTWEASK